MITFASPHSHSPASSCCLDTQQNAVGFSVLLWLQNNAPRPTTLPHNMTYGHRQPCPLCCVCTDVTNAPLLCVCLRWCWPPNYRHHVRHAPGGASSWSPYAGYEVQASQYNGYASSGGCCNRQPPICRHMWAYCTVSLTQWRGASQTHNLATALLLAVVAAEDTLHGHKQLVPVLLQVVVEAAAAGV